MPLDLLDTPLRVTWDIHGRTDPLAADDLDRVARRLSTAGVFFVLLDEAPLAHPAIEGVLAGLAGGGCRVSVVLRGGEEEFCRLSPRLALETVFLDAAHLAADGDDHSRLTAAVERVRKQGFEPSVWLTPLRQNLHLIPPLLSFCRDRQIGRFKLPNIKINDRFGQPAGRALLRPDDLDRLERLLAHDPLPAKEGVTLEVHDRFLWERLIPEEEADRHGYGGCQAANSLGHVDGRGFLLPCSAWPESLGSLLTHSLEELWQSPLRHQVRREIAKVPPGCRSCRDYAVCLGGCRGLGRVFSPGSGRDPLCRGPR